MYKFLQLFFFFFFFLLFLVPGLNCLPCPMSHAPSIPSHPHLLPSHPSPWQNTPTNPVQGHRPMGPPEPQPPHHARMRMYMYMYMSMCMCLPGYCVRATMY
ncbi:hypothetical protein BD289DRAFT_448772, partial [Coniella lustricola]